MATQRWIGAATGRACRSTPSPSAARPTRPRSTRSRLTASPSLMPRWSATPTPPSPRASKALLAASTPRVHRGRLDEPRRLCRRRDRRHAGLPVHQHLGCHGAGTLTTQASIAAPTISSTSTATSGGALLDTTEYFYKLTRWNACGETAASAEVNRTTGNSGSNVNTITINYAPPGPASRATRFTDPPRPTRRSTWPRSASSPPSSTRGPPREARRRRR